MAKKNATTALVPPTKTPTAAAMWTTYHVRWDFLTKLCGSVPADPEMVEKWIDARQPTVKPAGARTIEEINEEVLDTLERGEDVEPVTFNMLVFQRFDGSCVVRAGTIKAHLKDCARQVSSLYVSRIQGEKSFAVRVVNGLYLEESQYWIPIRRADGSVIPMADGAFDKAARATSPTGQRLSFLKRIEYITMPTIEFDLKVLGKSVREEDLHILFQYGGVHGYAGERGDGEGRYRYTLTRVEAAAVGD